MNAKNQLIIFDGFCKLCSRSVRFINTRDKKKTFSFIPLHDKKEIKIPGITGYDKNIPTTLFLVKNGKVYQKSDALLHIALCLGFPLNLLYLLIVIPSFIRDWVYMIVSKHRYKWFGERETCYIV